MVSLLESDVLTAATFPEDSWDTWDDQCDCMYTRIGFWTNPYLAETLEVRMCCIWDELYKLFPGKMRKTPAYMNLNSGEWEKDPLEWNGEYDMPAGLWYRQLSRQTGRSVAECREAYKDQTPPKGVPRPVVEEPEPESDPMMDMLLSLAQIVAGLKEQVEAMSK